MSYYKQLLFFRIFTTEDERKNNFFVYNFELSVFKSRN